MKVVNLEFAQKIVAEHDDKHETEVDGKVYKLRITLEDGSVEVKLTDLSEDISNEQISEYLSSYGEVLSVTEQLWDSKYRFAGLPTGTRIVRMVVKRNIESYITIDGQTTNVVYFGQLHTCRYCSEFVHNGISCVQNKKLLVQKTYANVAKQTDVSPSATKPVATKNKMPFSKLFGAKSREATASRKVNSNDSLSAVAKPSIPDPVDRATKPNPTEQSNSLMPPPAVSQGNQSTCRKSPRQASDGNDTDNSTTSNNGKRRSARVPGKKLRQNYDDDTNEEIDVQI